MGLGCSLPHMPHRHLKRVVRASWFVAVVCGRARCPREKFRTLGEVGLGLGWGSCRCGCGCGCDDDDGDEGCIGVGVVVGGVNGSGAAAGVYDTFSSVEQDLAQGGPRAHPVRCAGGFSLASSCG